MEKYKVCPSCGKHNIPTLLECAECETDLSNIKVVDEHIEQINDIIRDENELIKICECGGKNPSSARKCSVCNEDISDIIPTAKSTDEKNIFQYSLFAVDDNFTFVITDDIIIGREQAMREYLAGKTYVSRTHAKLTLVENKLYITNLSRTNFTYINNKKISDDSPHLLNDGDEIGLGGFLKNEQRQENAAYFIVRKSQCI